MTAIAATTNAYERRRKRANELAERWPFASEVLHFYAKLLDVQQAAFDEARGMEPNEAVTYAAERVVPRVVEVSAANGPAALAGSVLERFDAIDFSRTVDAWLRGDTLSSVDRFLARNATLPALEALGGRAGDVCEGPCDDLHCPVCSGLPQLSYASTGDEDLVTPRRYLECSRCSAGWPFARMICPSCGENDTANLLHFSEIGALEAETSGKTVRGAEIEAGARASTAIMPHASIDGCSACRRYVLNVDLRREPRAVPMVDELAALPLYVYASERELSKIVVNALGF